jgi:hypothetical protein
MGGKFFNGIWVNGGREMAHEIIKKSEKDTHDARAEARRAEEAAKRKKRIGNIFWFSASTFVFVPSDWLIFPTSAELSPPPEPFDPLADPKMKEALDIINVAEFIVDEVVNKLLNEVAEKVLKEE